MMGAGQAGTPATPRRLRNMAPGRTTWTRVRPGAPSPAVRDPGMRWHRPLGRDAAVRAGRAAAVARLPVAPVSRDVSPGRCPAPLLLKNVRRRTFPRAGPHSEELHVGTTITAGPGGNARPHGPDRHHARPAPARPPRPRPL